jgi:hypothetical protein
MLERYCWSAEHLQHFAVWLAAYWFPTGLAACLVAAANAHKTQGRSAVLQPDGVLNRPQPRARGADRDLDRLNFIKHDSF